MELTSTQKKAVQYTKGPLLIIAGAGTGKTTILVEKMYYIIKKGLAKPKEILALTFTDKAAGEIEERVDERLPYGVIQTNVYTFHSFCDTILCEYAFHIGLSPSYKLLTQSEAALFLKRNLDYFNLNYYSPRSNPHKFIGALVEFFSRLQDEDISPKDYIQWAKKNKKKSKNEDAENEKKAINIELAEAYNTFQQLKLRNNVMTFGDLIFYTLLLLRTKRNVLEELRKRYKYILIDEFQDTNIAQYELIKLLAPPDKKPLLTVIGDDNQSIYKFRGAAISNILAFMDDYPLSEKIVLLENFRSTQYILDKTYALIKNNDPDTLESRLDISKNLRSLVSKGDASDITLFVSKSPAEEITFVVKEIKKIVSKRKIPYSEIAILTRANNHYEPFINALSAYEIPYRILGQGILFKQPEVKDLIAYLSFCTNNNDSASLYRVLSMDFWKLDARDLISLTSFTKNTNLSLFEALEATLSFYFSDIDKTPYELFKKSLPRIKKDTLQKLKKIYDIFKKSFEKAKRGTATEVLFYFLQESGLINKLTSPSTVVEERKTLNIARFFEKLKAFETKNDNVPLPLSIEYILMSLELGDAPLAEDFDSYSFDGVNILTAHSAKGLEFDTVFLVNCTNHRFPTSERKEQISLPEELIKETLPSGDAHIQEERRLFYVACTRAKKKLYITASIFYGDQKRKQKISLFVYELLGEDSVKKAISSFSNNEKQLSIFNLTENEKSENFSDIKIPLQTTFSYTQLDTYNTCPLKYKYKYILSIPTIPTAVASFGDTIHKTLESFYTKLKMGEKVDLKTLFELYKNLWSPIGYSTKVLEKKAKEEGKKMLETYYKTYFNPDTVILDLERWFKIKIKDSIYIVGKIDRVDKKGKDEIEIIDYKTGKVYDEKTLKQSLQMTIYAISAQDSSLYKKPLSKITLTLFFISENQKVSFKLTKKDVDKVIETITKIAQGINNKEFKPKFGKWCDFCPYRINCEAWH